MLEQTVTVDLNLNEYARVKLSDPAFHADSDCRRAGADAGPGPGRT
jgi:hypothetical protein